MVDGINPNLPAKPAIPPIPLTEVKIVVLNAIRKFSPSKRHRLAHIGIPALNPLILTQVSSPVKLYPADSGHAHGDELAVHVKLLDSIAADGRNSRNVLGLRHARVPVLVVCDNISAHELSSSGCLLDDDESKICLRVRHFPVVTTDMPRVVVQF